MSIGKRQSTEENGETILIVEDDKSIRDGLAMNFKIRGYKILVASDGEEGMNKAFDCNPDLVILDVMLPGWSGLDILAELRQRKNHVPVLMLSARDTTANKIEGLDLGADDYLTKPFELRELIARVEAMLRRRRIEAKEQKDISFGDVTIQLNERRVTIKEKEIELSNKEFDLLCLLAVAPGRPFTRDFILDRIWGWGFDGTSRTVDNFIMSLRKKIENDPTAPRHIRTVRQVGYKLEP
jgi:DNA-binding response OmpR family regulator